MKDGLGDDRSDGWLLLGGQQDPDSLSTHQGSRPLSGSTLSSHGPVFAPGARGGGTGGSGGGTSGRSGGPVLKRPLR